MITIDYVNDKKLLATVRVSEKHFSAVSKSMNDCMPNGTEQRVLNPPGNDIEPKDISKKSKKSRLGDFKNKSKSLDD